ncbi:DUF418 domain-containing protein [Paenibacillus barcinonensis]|uniref:DUF418 domain-containing protein n=1 Tax=Paenibacillus barcinonensis TaxID=198119 RepID=A0A2V4VVT9_PAEBA|nr:DUF418 domain-containing protein [Paenibacillus barcinonensis]PYE49188.1 uncharacterized protein DFQ00_106169 [Paenibacillus barcinonensis]QKS55423.1 DUF418 domain-containing protein [Paenibacillus barcinonensis]
MTLWKEGHGQPLSPGERVHFLDIVRGFAMLGIIIVNYFLMVDFVKGFEISSDDPVHNWVSWFVEGKFITLFSFLFGVGFMIFMDRAVQRVAHPNRLFIRRLMILLVFGLLHITFVWVGDILSYYAIAGLLLLAFYNRSAQTLLRWIIVFIAVQCLAPMLGLLFNAFNNSTSTDPIFADFSLNSHSSGLSYLQSIGARWADMSFMAASSFFTVYSMFVMFLLGMYFVKMKWFQNMEYKKKIWKRIFLFSFLAYLITLGNSLLGTLVPFDNKPLVGLSSVLGQLGGVTGSMFYMSTLAMLFLYARRLRRALMIFSKVGRMSLTCYLLHSIIGTFLFLGYGFGLAEKVQPIHVVFISFGVYALLIVISTLWLKRYKSGPMEWIWRKLTYGGVKTHPVATTPHVVPSTDQ